MLMIGLGCPTIFTSISKLILVKLPDVRGAIASMYGFFLSLGSTLGPMIMLLPYLSLGITGIALTCLALLASSTAILLMAVRNIHYTKDLDIGGE